MKKWRLYGTISYLFSETDYNGIDVKVKCIEQGTTQAAVAEQIDTTKSYVNRVIKKPNGVVNNTFVQMMEALGYDIELHYVKREKTE